MRNPSSHDYHCSLLHGNFAEDDSTTYGVNHNSVLNDIPDFHVTDGQMPQDMMHVLLEGALPFEIKLMLKVFIFDRCYFDLNDFNGRLTSFVYGRNELRTKPPKLFERKHILGGSSLGLSG